MEVRVMASYSPVKITPLNEEPSNCATTRKRSCIIREKDYITSFENPRNGITRKHVARSAGVEQLVNTKNAEQCKVSRFNARVEINGQ